jgi:NAD(P)-dependent dehydrogenase (short-subunit alcohol dehydrogenase family)
VELPGKVAVITGGGNGIGRAMALRFAAEGATVVVADLEGQAGHAVADEVTEAGGRALSVATDVAVEADLVHLVERAEDTFGPIDLFCSNAGIAIGGGVEVADEQWRQIFDINVMAHVYAARAVLPGMLARGEGYLLNTVSAAGLLTNIGAAPYAVTKHAALALAEWLSVTHGDDGIKVSVLCPQGVRTRMLTGGDDAGDEGARAVMAAAGVLEPEAVADVVVQGLADERFLILPHPEVAEYFRRKAGDYDRWLAGMRRLQARARE